MDFDDFFRKDSKVYLNENSLPSPSIQRISNFLGGGIALDLGCGTGRNSIYLAKNGFNVVALDVSELAIKQFKEKINGKDLPITIFRGDINKFNFIKKFDFIISEYVFHFMKKEDSLHMIQKMKNNTSKGGFNFISVITGKKCRCNFKHNELKELYSDWKITFYKEDKIKSQHGSGPVHYHNTTLIIARKSL